MRRAYGRRRTASRSPSTATQSARSQPRRVWICGAGCAMRGRAGFRTIRAIHPRRSCRRVGLAWSLNEKTVVRGGYGLFWSPWIYVSPGTTNYGQTGYTRETFVDQSSRLIPTASLDNPFPNGLLNPVGNTLGLLTGVGGRIDFVTQDRQSPYVQQYSIDVQRELRGNMAVSIGYIGSRGDNLGYGGAGAAFVNI